MKMEAITNVGRKAGSGPLALLADRLARHSQLPAAARRALLALPFTRCRFEPKAFLLLEGEKSLASHILLSGFAQRNKLAGSGGRQIVALLMKGGLAGFEGAFFPAADHNVQALGTVEAAAIPNRALVAVAFAHPMLAAALWRESLIEASVAREWILNVGRRDARARILHLLCEFGLSRELAGLGAGDRFELPMSQEELADATGLTAVHVNRVLQGLSGEGLIERQRRRIRIVDRRRARRAADFSPAYLHPHKAPGESAAATDIPG